MSAAAPEDITIEGNATDVVQISEVPEYRRVFDRVDGAFTFHADWKPVRGCC